MAELGEAPPTTMSFGIFGSVRSQSSSAQPKVTISKDYNISVYFQRYIISLIVFKDYIIISLIIFKNYIISLIFSIDHNFVSLIFSIFYYFYLILPFEMKKLSNLRFDFYNFLFFQVAWFQIRVDWEMFLYVTIAFSMFRWGIFNDILMWFWKAISSTPWNPGPVPPPPPPQHTSTDSFIRNPSIQTTAPLPLPPWQQFGNNSNFTSGSNGLGE